MKLKLENIPAALRERKQFVLWKTVDRLGKPTKVPFRLTGFEASSTDPETWAGFDIVTHQHKWQDDYEGVGYVFAADDPFCGVDLDGCRKPETGELAEWAREIIEAFVTYAEVSPSKTGVKLWCVGKSPFDTGKNKKFPDLPRMCDKIPGIEIYDHGRYFAMTGWRLKGATEPQPRQEQLDWLKAAYWPAPPPQQASNFRSHGAVVERSRKYVATMPPAISEQGGHNQTFHVACVLVLGFGLPREAALQVLREYNERCVPPWSERELAHKVDSANEQPGERLYLRDVAPEKWASITVPPYKPPVPSRTPELIPVSDSLAKYIGLVERNEIQIIETGLPDLDSAIGGGVEKGEMIIVAARPNHGKSSLALQLMHSWSGAGRKCLVLSEEMSAIQLAKRTLQFTSPVPQEHWSTSVEELKEDAKWYADNHAASWFVEGCGTTEVAISIIDKAVAEKGVECVFVDYAQLLRSPGKTRYEQVTNTSIALHEVTARTGIILVALCQMNGDVLKRKQFRPMLTDIKETGQLAQDADTVLFLVWPHRLDSKNPHNEFQIFVSKNRNRPINQEIVYCRFEPSKQQFLSERPIDRPNYEHSFDAYNERKDFV